MYNLDAAQENWVFPITCLQLEKFLQVKTAFYWKVVGDNCQLVSSFFDPDYYYSSTNSALAEVGTLQLVRAFSLAEMDAILPDHTIMKRKGIYRINCIGIAHTIRTEHHRLADALALMVMECIRKNVIDISSIVKIYSQ